MKCPACPAKAAVCSGSWGAMEATAISSSLKLLITFPANKKALITTRKKRDTIQFSDQFPNSKSSTGHYPSPTGITINGRRLKTRFKILAINGYGISAAADIAQVEVTWQIIVGAIAGVTPFVVAGIEFSKRIEGFYRGRHGKDSSLVSVCVYFGIHMYFLIYIHEERCTFTYVILLVEDCFDYFLV
eukprot:XP_024436803.1 uncharacterized protein LOC18103253 isoform X2 [Populus trichocarpa]